MIELEFIILVPCILIIVITILTLWSVLKLTNKENDVIVPQDPISSRYYATCVFTCSTGEKIYRSFITSYNIEGHPSEDDLRSLRNAALASDPSYQDCVIIFFGRIKG